MTTLPWKQAGLIMALLGAASIVQAQEAGSERPSREEIIAKYDTDGDGQLSETERAAMREARGGKGGPKGGGKRGGAEGEGGQDKPAGERPSREEIMAKYDADGDGQLSEAERATLREAWGGKGGQRGGGKRGGAEGEGGQDKPAGERPSREEIMAKYDTDGDGQLSEAERAALREARGGKGGPRGEGDQKKQGGQRPSREEMMAKYDTDGDGKLSEAEREAMRQDRSAQ